MKGSMKMILVAGMMLSSVAFAESKSDAPLSEPVMNEQIVKDSSKADAQVCESFKEKMEVSQQEQIMKHLQRKHFIKNSYI